MLKNIFSKMYQKEIEQISVNVPLEQMVAARLGFSKTSKHFSLSLMIQFLQRWKRLWPVCVFAVLVLMVVSVQMSYQHPRRSLLSFIAPKKIDDWQYRSSSEVDKTSGAFISGMSGSGSSAGLGMGDAGWDLFGGLVQSESFGSSAGLSMSVSSDESLGFSVGGAKDIGSFRTNIENGFLPLLSSLTYEGLFGDYFFETGKKETCDILFCPSYRRAVTKNPLTGEEEMYVAVGLNSGMKQSDFARKKLNLVIVLDISGSMSSSFDTYYYDQNRQKEQEAKKTKIQTALASVSSLLDHLQPDDRLGIVLFNDHASIAKPLRLVKETEMEQIKTHLLSLSADGGTDFSAGLDSAETLFMEVSDEKDYTYENRMIILTDAMPNTGDISKDGLVSRLEKNAQHKVYTTCIGIGVDFQSALVEAITKIRGANYFSTHTQSELQERLDEGFDYMVSPLVFNLEMTTESNGFEIEQVYGSPEANKSTGNIMRIGTLFPSATKDGQTRGGIILLKVRKTGGDPHLSLRVNYEDRDGRTWSRTGDISFDGLQADMSDDNGVRKGVLLVRYGELIRQWIADEREKNETTSSWEQTSLPLQVSSPYDQIFIRFKNYFEQEAQEIGDATLNRERDILSKLTTLPSVPFFQEETGGID